MISRRAPPRIPHVVKKPKPKVDLRMRPRHLAFVRLLPCVCCGKLGPSEAAHVRIGGDGGMGLKPPDRLTVPLCGPFGCHADQHQRGEQAFWSELGIDPVDLAARLWAVSGDVEQGERAVARARQAIMLHKGK